MYLMKKNYLALCFLTTCGLMSTNSIAANTNLDELLLCGGWNERAQGNQTAFFLENVVSEYSYMSKSFKPNMQLFLKSYKEKKIPVDPDEVESPNLRIFNPINKSTGIFENIQINGYYGAGFRSSSKIKSNVNINELKAQLEKRDNFKFQNYTGTQMKQFRTDYKKLWDIEDDNKQNRERMRLAKLYPHLSALGFHDEDAKDISIFIKPIKNTDPFGSYIAIENQGTTQKPQYYLVCGVGDINNG